MTTPERQCEIKRVLDEILGPKPVAKPKLVCANGEVVADAVVIVSSDDPNWYKGPKAVYTKGEVQVRSG